MIRKVIQKTCYLLVLCFFLSPVTANPQLPFDVKSGSTQRDGTVYFLNAVFNINFPHYIIESFEQGFDLPLLMEVEVYRDRNYWVDEKVVYIKQQYRLQYHPMLDSISIFNVNRGSRQYFNSLSEAVNQLSVLLGYPMLDRNNLLAGETYYARLRLGIDELELPIPLKSSALWENDWDLASEWYEWVVSE